MRLIKTLTLLGCLVLGACSSARDVAYQKAADGLNKYCDSGDDAIGDAVVDRINRGLRDKGARGQVDGITCDE